MHQPIPKNTNVLQNLTKKCYENWQMLWKLANFWKTNLKKCKNGENISKKWTWQSYGLSQWSPFHRNYRKNRNIRQRVHAILEQTPETERIRKTWGQRCSMTLSEEYTALKNSSSLLLKIPHTSNLAAMWRDDTSQISLSTKCTHSLTHSLTHSINQSNAINQSIDQITAVTKE